MKVARLYTIDLDLVQRLGRVNNKSATVNQALRKFLNDKEGTNLSDFSIHQLIAALQSRFDQYSPEYQMLTTLIALL